MKDHLVDHIFHKDLVSDSTLHVVGVISNPIRYHSRYRLFRHWYKEMQATPHVKVYIVELAFGDRHFEVTDPNDPTHLQLRTNQELWHKENMINLGVRHLLPKDWRYLAWVDTDIHFRDSNWAMETLHQLQHHHVVQPWRDCVDLGSHGGILQHFQSFCYIHRLGVPKQTHPSQPYKYAHSGFAWACTRKFWENVGAIGQGLIDFAILGSADHHMAWGMINSIQSSVHQGMSDSFKRRCNDWQRAAYRVTGGNLGFVNTRIEHNFHGPKAKRKYRERWEYLINDKYDPDLDLTYDTQGVIRLINNPKLEDDIRKYFRGRSEDSIEEYV